MDIKKVKELFERIKRYYNMFVYDDSKIQEWHKFLKDYDPTEVNGNLDKYVSESHEQPPLVYALISGLQKTEQEPEKIYLMKCEYCGHPMYVGNDMTDFLAHERECMKIDFIDRMSVKFRGKHVATVKYYEMSKEELNRAYHQIMNYYLQNKDKEQKLWKEFPAN